MIKCLLLLYVFFSMPGFAAIQQGNSLIFTINEFYQADENSLSAESRKLFKLNKQLENMNLKIAKMSMLAPQFLCSTIKDYDDKSEYCLQSLQTTAFSCILKYYRHPVSVFFKKALVKNGNVDRNKQLDLTVEEISIFYQTYQRNYFACLLDDYVGVSQSLKKLDINKIVNMPAKNTKLDDMLSQFVSTNDTAYQILAAYGSSVTALACSEKNIQQCTKYDKTTCNNVFDKYALMCAANLKQKISLYTLSGIDGFEMFYENALRCEMGLYAKEYNAKIKKKQKKCLNQAFSRIVELGVKRTLGLIP